MAQQMIGIGTVANDGTGDDLRTAGDKINDNFTELYGSLAGLLDFQGATDCSANPNYPAASQGDIYIVSVAGKIGGASGKDVEVGDFYVALADNAGGTEASVGTNWAVLQANITGGSVISELDDIPDVNAPTPADGDVLTWDASPGEWVPLAPAGAGAFDLDDASDVNAPTPANGDVLTWDSTPGEWVPTAPSAGATTELDYGPPTTSTHATNRQTASNFTASAADVSGKGLRLSLNPTGTGDKAIARLKAAPSAPFQIDVRLRQTAANATGDAGIILYNSSNGRSLRLLQLTTGQPFSQSYSALETFNATIGTGVTMTDLHAWLRVTVDGSGNVAFFYSGDGAFFKAVGTTTLATYLTASGGSLDEVGVFARANGNGLTSGACFHWYDES